MLAGQFALALAAMFFGAALYITVAEQPARLLLDDKGLLAQWQPSYGRAAQMQSALVVLSTVLGLLAAWQMKDWRWLVGAAAMLANGPYTLIGIMPTNRLLNGIAVDEANSESRAMIEKWGQLHLVRNALGLFAMLTFLWALN